MRSSFHTAQLAPHNHIFILSFTWYCWPHHFIIGNFSLHRDVCLSVPHTIRTSSRPLFHFRFYSGTPSHLLSAQQVSVIGCLYSRLPHFICKLIHLCRLSVFTIRSMYNCRELILELRLCLILHLHYSGILFHSCLQSSIFLSSRSFPLKAVLTF